MIPRYLHVFIVLSLVLVFGCTHKYSQEQYNALANELNTCKQELTKAKADNESASKSVGEVRQKLDQTTQSLGTALSEKQDLLDKNIQCLEEKKSLIKQISQVSAVGQEKKEALARMNKSYDYVASLLEAERLNDQVYIIKAQDRIKIVIPQKTLFPTAGSAWLTPKGTKLVKKIATGIKHLFPSTIEVSGHTDNTFIADAKNSYPNNWHLAHARALSVLAVLEESHVKKDCMFAASYGDAKPIADNSSDSGKAMNRRVEIVLTP